MLSTDFETALTYLRAGRASDAFNILSRIVDRWPTYAAAQVAYAQALHDLGQPEASFQAWSRAEALVSHSDVIAAGLLRSASAMFAPEPAMAGPEVPDATEEFKAGETHAHPEEEDHDAPETSPVDPDGEDAAGELPEFTDAAGMDPAYFVPIATPFDESAVEGPDQSEEPEWDDGPVASHDTASARPEWEGGYAGDSGDGAGSDLELDAPPEEGDLDRLIGELESARIVPAQDPSSIPPPDLSDDIDDVVSETLARIYATQNQFSEAARVYERLALENPDRAEEYQTKASEMRGRAR